ncbi:MAG TPA: cation diffusion facilitator family transporter [Thermoplasmata archaeon]|nr:cation diffusion facilitator family transporter [Thermoplasmata archaeon]
MRPQVVIVATILLDAFLFGINILVASRGGSRVVLSQAVFNAADLLGGGMVYWGFLRSQQPPDISHPFGYGKERFFWAFVASLLTFTIAGLVVFGSGFDQVIAPGVVSRVGEGLLVVGATLVVSVAGILIMLRELRLGQETVSSLIESAHVGLKTIFYQDVVSVFGSAVAFVGLIGVYRSGSVFLDGLTAAVVGLIMIATGLVLVQESRDLLVGKAISPEQARSILQIVERDPRVRQVRSLQSMMLGPDEALLAMRINFRDGMDTDQIESAIDQVSLSARKVLPQLKHVIIEPES